jgi:hypothetical protein
MKKIIVCILIVAITLVLSSCNWNESIIEYEGNDNRISYVYNDGVVVIYVDNDTGIQYLCRGNAGICVMVDESGKPLIYERGE